MVELTLHPAAGVARDLALESGVYVLGHGGEADVEVEDASIGPRHCEITIDGSTVLFRALEGATGLALDGRIVMEGQLEPGQLLQLGSSCLTVAGTGPTSPPMDGMPGPGWERGGQAAHSAQSPWPGGGQSPGQGPQFTAWQPHDTSPRRRAFAATQLPATRWALRVPKLLLFGLLGAAGSVVGCLLGGPLLGWIDLGPTPYLVVRREHLEGAPGPVASALVSGWSGFQALFVASFLVMGQNALLRRTWLGAHEAWRILLRSALVACVAGFLGQRLIWMALHGEGDPGEHRLWGRLGCWMLLGGLMAPCMGSAIPNLPRVKAIVAGAFGGGFAASLMALLLLGTMTETLARLLGVSVLGLYIGLMVAWVERSAREAALIVHWSEGERTILNLGPEPIVLGSCERAHIQLPADEGFPPEAGLVTFQHGRVEFTNHLEETQTVLANGSIVEIGGLRLEIQTDH